MKMEDIIIGKNEIGRFSFDGEFSVRLDEGKILLKPITRDYIHHNPIQTKQFKHDCKHCIFLDTVHFEKEYDLYYCDKGEMQTVVARYGNEGSEYSSGLQFDLPVLNHAKKIAEELGLLKETEVIECPACSKASGADRAVEHLPPICKEKN